MDLKEAFAFVAGICVNHNTTLEGHQRIQKALEKIRVSLFPEVPEAPKDEETN